MKAISDIDDYLKANKFICSQLGMWPGTKYVSKFRLVLMALAVITSTNLFVPQVLALVEFGDDIRVLTGVGCIAIAVGRQLFEVVFVLIKRKKICRLYDTIVQFWYYTDDPKERELLEKLAHQAQMFTSGFYVTALLVDVSFFSSSINAWIQHDLYNKTDAVRFLPFPAWYGFDITDNPCFGLFFVFQIFSALMGCAIYCGLDGSLMAMILHTCGQFGVLKERFVKIGRRMEEENFIFLEGKRTFYACFQHHEAILTVVEELNSLLMPIIFVQLITSGLTLCLSIFNVTLNGTNMEEIAKFTVYLATMLSQLVLWCWPGEVLIEQSSSVGDTIYFEVPWYRLPKLHQKNFSFIISRAQQTCGLYSFGSDMIRLSKLTYIFKTAGSYFTLLQNIYTE